ncbi:ATP-binding protein, partial [Pseudomonadota bacterium]
MEALGTLIGGIAHDFNNILTGITGNLSIAIHDLREFPEIASKLQIAEDLGFDAADMIKQLMAFSRKGLVKMKPFGLISFIEDISTLVKTSIPENISFRLEHCNEELVIKGDPTQLQQVLMNMLNNARDAVEGVSEAKVLLKIEEFEADEEFIKKHPEIDGRLFAHLIVEDNGSGISSTNREHLFEPFFTTKEVGLGTGLGLSMAYGAIQSHRGTIEVESTLGKGTSFHIYLPLIEERKIDITSVEPIETVSGNGELILAVDDNADVRHAIKDILNRLNYRVLEASDGLEAVDVVTANGDDISLIIMDVVMPRLGGVAAVERIRKINPEAKVIFSTGYDKDETLKNDMPSDEYIVLTKPYNFAQLSQMIRSQLDS